MKWRHSGSPHPKIFRVQKSAGKFLASIIWDQDGDNILIDYLAKHQTINAEFYSFLMVRFKDFTFWRKNAAGKSPRELLLKGHCSCSPDTCNPEETDLPGLPMYWSPNLFSWSDPVGLPPIPWTEKQLKGRHFSSDAEVIAPGHLVGRTIFWIFLSSLQKSEQLAKICIELHGEYVQQIHSLVAVVGLLPGRAKDLSAPHLINSVTVELHQQTQQYAV